MKKERTKKILKRRRGKGEEKKEGRIRIERGQAERRKENESKREEREMRKGEEWRKGKKRKDKHAEEKEH